MEGNDEYSDEWDVEFLLGKVHRKALASRHATWCWLIDITYLPCFFKSGIALVIISGSLRARFIKLGKVLEKNSEVISPESLLNKYEDHQISIS